MPTRGNEENLENYSIRLEAYIQLLEPRVKKIRIMLFHLTDAQYNVDILVDRIQESVR